MPADPAVKQRAIDAELDRAIKRTIDMEVNRAIEGALSAPARTIESRAEIAYQRLDRRHHRHNVQLK
jgi:hypothetical protein